MLGLLLAVALASEMPDFIRTKDGKLHEGEILSETSTGYLFRDDTTGETSVIEFSTIQNMRKGSDAPKEAPPPPPAPRPRVDSARIAQLTVEIHDLNAELDESTIWPAFVKFGLSVVAAAVGVVGFAIWASDTRIDKPTGGLLAAAVGAGLWGTFGVWGGLQLLVRMGARTRIPREIADREEQIRKLQAEQSSRSSLPAFFSAAAALPRSEHELREAQPAQAVRLRFRSVLAAWRSSPLRCR